MPITPSITTRRLSQKEFGELSFEVMEHVFSIHSEFGRLFDEEIYKKELAARMGGVSLEVFVDVTHGSFAKRYFADVIVQGSGLFEFKAAETIHARHRGQTIHYLLLFDLAHGKIVNVRTESVQHEFANCHRRLADLRQPTVVDVDWKHSAAGSTALRDTLMALIGDWGTGLDIALYREALEHFFNANHPANSPVQVFGSSGHLADQRMSLISPVVAFKLSAFSESTENLLVNARKLLRHTRLKAIQWANLTHGQITFTTILP